MMLLEQQWDRSNCRHFRIDVCLHQRIYMRAFTYAGVRERPAIISPDVVLWISCRCCDV